MKYCPSCKKIFTDDSEKCLSCKKTLKVIEDINEPVCLAVVGGTERAMLTGILKDNEIPFVEQNMVPQGVANELVTGYDVKLSNIIVTIPYSAIPKGVDLLLETGIEDKYIGDKLDKIKEDIEEKKSKIEKSKEMSSAKRTTIKIITAILFLALIALVVFGTDYVVEFFKNLFGGCV